ncbi:hypothetical protein M9H77_15130 [Catharanthus roseus]|uniref:Uncharacterized protein n=1 Tax=Catharanthus roseus TaxID=4058 RepID=A0ACC0BQ45_CATRO|nr:hypothetical protein M9H77_15130 [Catharanthus roseus]
MGGGHFLQVYNSSCAYRMKRLTAYIPMSVKRYSELGGKKLGQECEEHVQAERATSTADEFRRVAEERNRRQGSVASHHDDDTTTEKDEEEAGESGKGIFKEPAGDAGVAETSSG